MDDAGAHDMSLVADALVGSTPAARPLIAALGVTPLAINVIPGDEWDAAVAGFDEVCQEQLYAFARMRWPSVDHEPLIIRDGGEVVAGCLVMIQRLPLGVAGVAIAKWGPIFAKARQPQNPSLYKRIVDALVEEYAVKRRLMVSIWPNADLDDRNAQYETLIARGFKKGAGLLFPNRYIVNLRLSDAEQRKSLHQKWRYHLNKAEKAGLSFEVGGAERLPEFDLLYNAMTDRKKFADHSAYHTVPSLMDAADPALQPRLFFVRHEGELVSGAIIFTAGDRAVYLYGATNDNALPLRAGYFLHWQIIRWLRDNTRATGYDLGGTDGFQGLHQFKKGMVGEAGWITPVAPVANYAAYRLPLLIGTTAYAARDLVQEVRRWLESKRADLAKRDQAPHVDKGAEA